MAKLTARQERFMIALLDTNTIEEAFTQAGISQTTAYKYLGEPEFQAEYRKKRREIMQHVTTRLQQSATLAVDTLNEIMEDKENSTPSARVQSAKAVLDNAYKGIELEDLAERIENLEGLLNERT